VRRNETRSRTRLVARSDEHGDEDPVALEWGRLRRAIAFFLVCLALFVALLIIGLYH
jgi:hypothetical protein